MWDLIDVGYISLALRHFLAWVFLISAVDKFLHLARFQSTLVQYPHLPTRFILPLSVAIPGLEVLVAASLLLGLYWRIGALGAAALLVIFTIALITLVAAGVETCGCGGLVVTETIGPSHFISNILMMVAALIVGAVEQSSAALPLPVAAFGLHHTSTGFDPAALLVVFGTLVTILSLASAREVLSMRSRLRAINSMYLGR